MAMKTRVLVAAAGVPLLVCALTLAPPWVTTVTVALIAVVSAREFLVSLCPDSKRSTLNLVMITAVFTCCIWSLPDYGGGTIAAVIRACVYIIAFTGVAHQIRTTYKAFIANRTVQPLSGDCFVDAGLIFPTLLSAVITLRMRENGQYLVLLPVLVAFITDGGAYFTGVFFGKHKAFPNVSPKKTVEGCIGGIAAGVIATVAYGVFLSMRGFTPSYFSLVLCGIFGAAATEAGDLIFSLFKRARGVKDYGNLLPGHGGMLDRFDSMVTTAPVVWAITTVFPVML